MNFVQQSIDTASYDPLFRKRVKELCEKCIIHFPEKNDLKEFLQQCNQLIFLEKKETLDNPETEILRIFYMNNKFLFLVFFQLWMKFGGEFMFLEPRTLKFAFVYESNKVKKLLSMIEKLNDLHTRITVFSKSFFLIWLKSLTRILCKVNLKIYINS